MSGEELLDKLFDICFRSDNPDEILESLNKLRDLQASGRVTLTKRLDAQLHAFRNMRILLQNVQGTQLAEKAILEYLLPDCLLLDEPSGYLISQHRSVLSEWLDDFEDSVRKTIRAQALETVLPLLETPTPQVACWVISSIGYRDARVVQSLWKLMQSNDNEMGDIALSTIIWLGIPEQEKDGVVQELHSRATKRYNNHLLWGIARLGDASSAPVILGRWLSSPVRSENQADAPLAFTALREIADANDGDYDLQDMIWTECQKLVEQNPKDLYWDLDIGHVVVACNSLDVVPTLMRWHGRHLDWFEKPGWARYLAQERLERCTKPRQLEGWTRVDEQAIFELLRQDACLNTKDDGFYTTQEAMTKESAWKTLLRAGYGDTLNWFEAAVSHEEGRFVRQKVMKYLACFRIDPLPDAAINWITESYDDPGTGDGREMSYRMTAVRMARSTATQAALEHLANFGFTYKGIVITEPGDAVAEVALALLRQGNSAVVDRLAAMITESAVNRQRLVCAQALEVIASRPEYHKFLLRYAEAFIPLVYDEGRDQIERGLLLYALGHLTGWVIPEHFLQDLISWAHQPDRWIGGGSLEILASHGHLEKHLELMRGILGLERDGDFWRLASGEVRFEWAPYIIGLLYHNSPQAYTHAIVSLVANRDWQLAVQVVRWLHDVHGNDGSPELPGEIIEALIRRTHEYYSPFYGETETFSALAKLAPRALVEHNWNEIVASWMPDTRVALANALGKAKTQPDNLGCCLTTLEMLAEDSLYPVRRAAYRGLAKQSATYLYKLCQTWLDSPILKLNLRAAEACGWIEKVATKSERDGFEELYQRCASHSEPNVREAVHRSWEERRHRLWAREYVGKVMSVEGKDNLEVLRTWCYGDALGQVGDDECREILREHLAKKPLPPNVRYWIKCVLEGLETNWKKTTQNWPDPWADMSGAIERGDGKLISGPDKVVDIQYSTWRVPAASPGEKPSWGGIMIASFEHFLNLDKAVVELEGERQGEIFLTGFMGNTATFFGVGDYPRSN